MEIPDSNDPLGHADGLERPIPTPKGKIIYSYFFFPLPKYKHNLESTRKILLLYVHLIYLWIQVCKKGNLAWLNTSDSK